MLRDLIIFKASLYLRSLPAPHPPRTPDDDWCIVVVAKLGEMKRAFNTGECRGETLRKGGSVSGEAALIC